MRKISNYTQEQTFDDNEIANHYNLVRRIAYHLSFRLPSTIALEDLIQAGMEGVLQAQRGFDISRGIEFEAFAKVRIRGAMLDEVRRISHSTRNIISTKRIHDTATRQLTQELGRPPRSHEIAEKLELSIEDYEKERILLNSTDHISSEDSPSEYESMQGMDGGPQEELEREQQLESLTLAISKLPERSQQILALYYQEEMNLKEIGATLNVSESRISQILSEVAGQLRKLIR